MNVLAYIDEGAKLAMRQRSRRLRKKLRLDEFQQLGFEISITMKPNLEVDDIDRFLDEFILDAIEKNELAFGGGTAVASLRLGSAAWRPKLIAPLSRIGSANGRRLYLSRLGHW